MDSWLLILLSVGAVIISAVSKNKKKLTQQGRHAAGTKQEYHSSEEEISIPDIFSTMFDFGGSKEVEKEEVLEAESKNFHDRFEEAVVEEVDTETFYNKYEEVVASEQEDVPDKAEISAYVQIDNNKITGEAVVKSSRERIDPRKMIIYSELLKPKYKEV